MPSLPLTPTSELEAVNLLLLSIGETPTTGLNSLTGDAAAARLTLHETSRNLQDRGWSFNTDEGLKLMPDNNGEVLVPLSVARVDIAEPVKDIDRGLILRGRRFYDRIAHTYRLDRPVTVDAVSFLSWNDLPHYARRFVIAQAVIRFMAGASPDPSVASMWRDELILAQVSFDEAELDIEDPNSFTAPVMAVRTHRRL